MPYLIDGHNLIPKAGLRLDAPDDELDLIVRLQEFARLSRREVHVYFDGAPPGRAGSQRFGRVTAYFVARGRTADSAIQNRLNMLAAAARNWIVVSSDRGVQGAARAAHAVVMPSEEFAVRLTSTGNAAGRRGAKAVELAERQLSEQEVAQWLEAFRKPP
jgi:predicted RNA-binding protein with PIN domain